MSRVRLLVSGIVTAMLVATQLPGSPVSMLVLLQAEPTQAEAVQCSNQQLYEYTFTSVTNGNFYSVAVGSQPGGAVTCVNNPPAGGWTLADNECIASDSTVGCKSMVCQWQRPTTRTLEYSMSHWGAQYNYENVDCAQYPKAGYTLKAKTCVVPSTAGGCASDICFWEKEGTQPNTVTLGHYGSSAANREFADCRQYTQADRVERQCLLSAEHCLSDICLQSDNIAACTAPVPQCRDGQDNDGDGKTDLQDPGCANSEDNSEANDAVSQCPSGPRVAIDFERVRNAGNGNTEERVFFGNNSTQSVGDLVYIDLVQNGQYIVDASVNRNIPGLSLERGAGFIKVNLHGYLGGGYPNHYESVKGKVLFQNATIVSTGSTNEGLDGMEGQGNGTFDATDSSPDDEVFADGRFYVSVDSHSDTFVIYYNPNAAVSSYCVQTPVPQCRDGVDNDNDGKIDFPTDPGCVNSDDNDETNVITGGTVTVTKSAPTEVNRGSSLQYSITVRNTGNTTLSGILADPIDVFSSHLTFVSGQGTAGSQTVQCTKGGTNDPILCGSITLTPNQVATYVINLNVKDSAACESTISNVADFKIDGVTTPVWSNTTQTRVSCFQAADLRIQKSGPSSVTRGGTITYTVTAYNEGPATANNVIVMDSFPSTLTYLPSSSSSECSLVGNVVKCQNLTIAANASKTFSLTFSVPSQQNCSQTSISNSANILMPNGQSVEDPDTSNNHSPTVTTTLLCPTSDVSYSFSKTDDRSTVQAGDTLTYRLTLTNTSTSTASNISVIDTLPSGLSYLSSSDAGAINGQTVTWNNITLAAGQTKVLTISALVGSSLSNNTVITNTATVVGTGVSATDTTTVSSSNNNQLTVTKTDNRSTVQPGETLTYTITINNPSSTPVSSVTVTDLLPSTVTFISASDNGYLSGQTVLWNIIPVPANGSKTLTLQVRVNNGLSNGTVITNTATVTTSTTTFTGTDTTIVSGNVNNQITVEITDTPDPVRAGELLTYTIRVNNNQSFNRTVTVTQTLASRVQYLSSSDNGSHSNDIITWSNLSIPANGTKVLTVTVRVRNDSRDGDTFRTTVYADGASDEETTRVQGDQQTQCNDGRDNDNDGKTDYPSDPGCSSRDDNDERDNDSGNATVTVQKYADRSEAYPGDQIYYSVSVRNASSTTARDIVIEDTFPSYALTISDVGNGQVTGNKIRWTIASLAGNETRVFTYRATLASSLTQGTSVENNVTVTGTNLGSTPSARATVHVIERLPQTGAEDFSGPLENTRRFLSPVSGANGGIPAIVWSAIMMLGLAIGGRIGKQYFL